MKKIAIILTCHNRLIKTRKCLNKIFGLKRDLNIKLDIYLTDDGSKDGTSDYIKKNFPKIKISKGDGNLFWAGGMRLAWKNAEKKNHDYYLWLNDDVYLYENFTYFLLKDIENIEKNKKIKKYIISYPTFCSKTKSQSTGAKNLIDNIFKFRFSPVKKKKNLNACDTFNGNCVLITSETFSVVGNLDKNYTHRFADFDYGLMAKKKGVINYFSNKYAGICFIDNKKKYSKDDYKEWIYFLKKNSKFWVIHYLKFIISGIIFK